MKYNILKPGMSIEPGVMVGRDLKSTFNIDAFSIDRLTITKNQWYEFFDLLSGDLSKNTKVSVDKFLVSFLIENAERRIPTIEEMISFMYLLLRSPMFRYEEFFSEAVFAYNFNTMCKFFQDTGATVPTSFLKAVSKTINSEAMYHIVVDRYDFKVSDQFTPQEIIRFNQSLEQDIEGFYNSTDKLSDMLGDLGISHN